MSLFFGICFLLYFVKLSAGTGSRDVTDATSPTCDLELVLPCQRFSTIGKLFRVTSYVLPFFAYLQKNLTHADLNYETPSSREIAEAKFLWYKHIQGSVVSNNNFKQVKVSLDLFEDEHGIWRCGGRLANASTEFSAKHPVLLPNDCHVSKLLVEEIHRKVKHNGVRETLCELCSQYWIVKGRQFVRKVVARFVTCKRQEGGTYQSPPHSPLPEFRVTDDFAFTRVGVDFAGPLYVKLMFTSDKGPNVYKSYFCLFTCASSRAAHLELIPDLSTETFV